MKQKLLLLLLLSVTVAFANKNPNKNAVSYPEIGLMMRAYNQGDHILYQFYIKNTGDETLTNVYITEAPGTSPITYQFSPIASLAPGEEIAGLYGVKNWQSCTDESQTIVHATTAATTEITDLSSNPDYYNGQVGGTYYNDSTTAMSQFEVNTIANETSVYNDLNGNGMVDVGDAVYYFYNYSYGVLFDDNAEIVNTYFTPSGYQSYGIHYLTQAEVNLGFVYNNSSVFTEFNSPSTSCYYSYTLPFYNQTICFCPNPGNANMVTALNPVLPNQISGKIKFNTNNDNCISGTNFPNKRVSASDGSNVYASYTNTLGDYHILIPNYGNYLTNALDNLNPNFSSNPTAITVSSSGSGTDYTNNDFCISSATGYTDLTVNMFNINQAIPGNVATYRIYYQNTGSTALNGNIQLTFDSGKLTLSNAYPLQSSATAISLTWNYTNLSPLETRYIDLSLNVGIPPTVNAGDLLAFSVVANPIAADDNPADNTYSFNQTVRSSFDPNDKTVIEGPSISTAQTTNYLHYVTRFQNTGTANATTVVIKEYLDPKLNWDTFEPVASSHPSNIQLRNGNELTYTFSNINLPYQSANEPASHGWMAYRIKPKNNVIVGDIMTSGSAIYFDYNPPIQTNNATTEVIALATADFIKSNFSLYPNPAANYLIIEAKTNVESVYEIIDINGKLLLKGTTQTLLPIDIHSLQSGFYFLTLKTNEGKATFKFIKN